MPTEGKGMVQPRSSRPRRRNRDAGPERSQVPAQPPQDADGLDPVLYPNLAAQREMDRLEHVRRGRAMGLTPEQAERHADEHAQDRRD